MVIGAGSVYEIKDGSGAQREMADTSGSIETGVSLHERLVAYVHSIAEEPDSRSGVWVEHSYARARNAPAGGGASAGVDVRVLFAPRLPRDSDDLVDVDGDPPTPPTLPVHLDDLHPTEEDEAVDAVGDEQWEERVTTLAPSATHARLAAAALDAIRDLRLARLVGGWGRREAARAAARRLRRALAPLWAWSGPAQQRPAAWLHATLYAHLPRPLRALYDEMVVELRRAAPKLADRLLAGRLPAPSIDPLEPVGESVPAGASGPWVVWVMGTRATHEARWAARLRTLVHTRAVPPPDTARVPPDAHCAALAAATRASLLDVLAEAGDRAVVAGGACAGAALVAAAAGGAGVASRLRGLMLLAPPLLTAEGSRDAPDDPLHEVKVPTVVVCGTGGAAAWRWSARELTGGSRRLVEVRGADDALRLPAAHRAAHRLSQHALDAAIVEECARWAAEVAEAALVADEADAYAHPPPARAAHPAPAAPHTVAGTRAIEIVEGRVVCRAARGVVEPIDIMQMPIVFADDETDVRANNEPSAGDKGPALTVTSGNPKVGGVKYTRVIVAKRGRSAAGVAAAGPSMSSGAGLRTEVSALAPRPLVARRPLRLVARNNR